MHIRDFFYFPKSDRSVMIVLLIVATVSVALIFGIGGKETATSSLKNDNTHPQKTAISSGETLSNSPFYDAEKRRKEVFPFDPNTADSTQLLRLGLQKWQIRNIYKYRSRGGIYRRPEDFARLYGLTQGDYRRLKPYIRISDDYRPASELIDRSLGTYRQNKDTLQTNRKFTHGEKVNINIADTALLQRIPGIGRYFARRIVDYRSRLGGFHSLEQLSEIEGFPEKALQNMSIDHTSIRKLNLNKSSFKQLCRHPYIGYAAAQEIMDYRRLKGTIHNLDDLRFMKSFSSRSLERFKPYAEF